MFQTAVGRLRSRSTGSLALLGALLLYTPAFATPMVIFDLRPAYLFGGSARLSVIAEFIPDSTEGLVSFGVDVSASSASLTGSGLGYSAFSFEKYRNVFIEDWNTLATFGPNLTQSVHEEGTLTTPVGAGTHFLGVLTVDYDALGLVGGSSHTVDISGSGTAGGYQGVSLGFADIGFVNSSSSFVIPGGTGSGQPPTDPDPPADSDPPPVPEPATMTLTVLGALGAAAARRRRRRR